MAMIIGENGGAPAGGAAPVKDVTTDSFEQDVLKDSVNQPVVVDMWAPWCEPCKQLGPMLEKVVNAAGGRVKMVKINIDEEPQIAQALRVQSIPAVFAFDQGQPVDGFVGVQPESQIKAFVERLAGEIGPSPVDQALEQAGVALEAGEFEQAAGIYQQVMAHEAGNVDAIAGLCRALIGLGRADDVRDLLEALDDETQADEKIIGVRAQLELMAGAGGDTADLEAKVAANGNDFDARLELAQAYAAMDRREDAVDQLIAIIEVKRDWNEEAARMELLKFFEAWGPTDEATADGRRKLSSAWFS
ncbi:MAG: thioredoxin [Alphaproteobacteria bacterium]|nr:thioredoxin [Rhodospirillaceae bacterium]MBT6510259.1 thioredoxin [Rhodospirillaceae bacterium]MBT7612069.1 thioredoxin [Rhodospirillaceae bacterium]MBT7647533.1 thioredoxin [Rhodospirillaceae bacterium]MDG2483012.1 thioredoxin [Alphaproteobacteria bacterium]